MSKNAYVCSMQRMVLDENQNHIHTSAIVDCRCVEFIKVIQTGDKTIRIVERQQIGRIVSQEGVEEAEKFSYFFYNIFKSPLEKKQNF